jgi:4'-phosphopantetheinyl transferase
MTPLLGDVRRVTRRLYGQPVQIWVARIQDADPDAASGILSAAEQARAAGIAAATARGQYVAGRVLSRLALAVRTGVAPGRVPIGLDPTGRPHLADRRGTAAGVDFNLSHSGRFVAVAVATGLRIGIDVEQHQPRHVSAALSERFFSPAEHEWLEASRASSYPRRWGRVWTTREAHAKARGIGVRGISASLGRAGRDYQHLHVPVAAGYTGTAVALPL